MGIQDWSKRSGMWEALLEVRPPTTGKRCLHGSKKVDHSLYIMYMKYLLFQYTIILYSAWKDKKSLVHKEIPGPKKPQKGQKNSWVKNILVQKKIGVKRNFVQKNFGSK